VIGRALGVLGALLFSVAASEAQPPTVPSQPTAASAGILDNSFLVEETFNQDPGVVQTTFSWVRSGDSGWRSTVAQDWPLLVHRHQFSWALPWSGGGIPLRTGQVVVSYRYQFADLGEHRPAVAARISAVLPRDRPGEDHLGLQAAVPMTIAWRRFHVHANAGVTWTQQRHNEGPGAVRLASPYMAASTVWPTESMFQLMLEDIVEFEASLDDSGGRRRRTSMTLSPGLRGGWNIGRNQLVVGTALPVDVSAEDRSVSLLGYVSFEGPLTRRR
jgi:hypothetical protein